MSGDDNKGAPREIFFEFRTLGDYTRCNALDPETGIEVSVAGPKTVARSDLEKIAMRKLMRRIEAAAPRRRDKDDGIVV